MNVTGTWQDCPHCKGTGVDPQALASTTFFPMCTVCKGQKIISQVNGQPPILNPAHPSSPTATAEKDQMEASILKETEEITLIEWSDPKLGFGRLDLVYKGDGTYTVDAEAMSVKTIIRILKAIGK